MNSRSILGWCAALTLVAGTMLFCGVALAEDKPADNGGSGGGQVGGFVNVEGKPAPDFTLQTASGQDVKLSDLKGKVVVLDFWATWCGPCKQSLPHLQELANDKDLAGKGLKVYAVNLKESDKKVQDFLQKNNYTFEVPLDKQGSVAASYGVSMIPLTVVIGRDGVVKKTFTGFSPDASPKELKQTVEDALGH